MRIKNSRCGFEIEYRTHFAYSTFALFEMAKNEKGDGQVTIRWRKEHEVHAASGRCVITGKNIEEGMRLAADTGGRNGNDWLFHALSHLKLPTKKIISILVWWTVFLLNCRRIFSSPRTYQVCLQCVILPCFLSASGFFKVAMCTWFTLQRVVFHYDQPLTNDKFF